MATELITSKIWQRITKAAKDSRTKSHVAVAYFGKGGADLLPLKKGSILLVDASLGAVKAGQTHPDDLLKLYYKGVKIYSWEFLHAKIFVLGGSTYIGSTNVSTRSAQLLKEVLVRSNDKSTTNAAMEFIKSLCGIELGEEELKRLSKQYRPPKTINGIKLNVDKQKQPDYYVARLSYLDYDDEHQEQHEKGRPEAERRFSGNLRHELVDYSWHGSLRPKKNDYVIQVILDEGQLYVYPVGKVLSIRSWTSKRGAQKSIVFLEIPKRRRKRLYSLQNRLTSSQIRVLERNGKITPEFAKVVASLWK